ncbi:glycosyltransferase [Terasakiella sp. A23]|uniref:glycosyltransferase family 2 protein n=1 Tax=Terasakiella sp. FCG-A23 TaxID=3080561 RepID=UPI0029531DF6|nr:glycosyltransferase [Terasakiella sp. A23]MDV7341628.1 glycosyltransferase [Terasakiella sp. A23]
MNKLSEAKVGLIVPTRNAGKDWLEWIAAYQKQTFKPSTVLIIDSSSEDDTVKYSLDAGFKCEVIKKENFDHGRTRDYAISLLDPDIEIAVLLTQDAILHDDNAIEKLVESFNNEDVAMAYGRQLPHFDATHTAIHQRHYSYADYPRLQDKASIDQLGIKAAFCSNSFSAYRLKKYKEYGGFPDNIIFGEDMYLAAKMVLAGQSVAYASDALVRHSHNYTIKEDFKRCFDIGVFHVAEGWILKNFGRATGEGKKFVFSEISYLLKNNPLAVITSVCRCAAKVIAYKLGRSYKKLPTTLCKSLSMNAGFWK